MTAQLRQFTTIIDGLRVTVSLHYDKHELFCVTTTRGDVEKNYPSFKSTHWPNMLKALEVYNRQKRSATVKGCERVETISPLYDKFLDAAKNPEKYA